MSPLDSMLSQYRFPSGAPQTAPTMPVAPSRPIRSDVGASPFGSSSPNSFFSAANAPSVPLPPTNVTAGGTATGTSPFGMFNIPDLRGASPQQLRQITDFFSNNTYSVPLGGYITSAEANDPNSAYVKGYYGKPMTGGDAGANAAAARVFNMIGSFPTIAPGTPALNALYQSTGIPRPQGPSLNTILGRPYGGPWETPTFKAGT